MFDFINNPFEKEKEWYDIEEFIRYDWSKCFSIVLKNNKYFKNIKNNYAGSYDTIEEATQTIKKIKTSEKSRKIVKSIEC